MGRMEYWDPVTQSRKPAKAGSIVDNTGLEYSPSDVKTINDKTNTLEGELVSHKAESTQQAHLPKNVGLANVDNIKQMPLSGGNFTGISKAHPNTSYTVAQLRNVILSTGNAVVGSMNDGDIWIKYK